MASVKIGARVPAVRNADDKEVFVYGEGVYIGNHAQPIGTETCFGVIDKDWPAGVKNPCVQMDSGGIVWGNQCWWGGVESARTEVGGMKETIVPPPSNPPLDKVVTTTLYQYTTIKYRACLFRDETINVALVVWYPLTGEMQAKVARDLVRARSLVGRSFKPDNFNWLMGKLVEILRDLEVQKGPGALKGALDKAFDPNGCFTHGSICGGVTESRTRNVLDWLTGEYLFVGEEEPAWEILS